MEKVATAEQVLELVKVNLEALEFLKEKAHEISANALALEHVINKLSSELVAIIENPEGD